MVSKREITAEQKRLDINIWIIVISTFLVLGLFMGFQKPIYAIVVNNELPIIPRTFFMAVFQFGLAGLGITIVSIFRRESFFSYGLKAKGIFPSVECVLA